MTNMKHTEARDHIVEELRRLMVGPYGGQQEVVYAGRVLRKVARDGAVDEDTDSDHNPGDTKTREFPVIEQTPYDFYHTGFLSPTTTEIDEEEDDQEEQGSDLDHGTGEGIMVMANSAQQAAMGMTFQIKEPEIHVAVTARWAKYVLEVMPKEDEGAGSADTEREPQDSAGATSVVAELFWKRQPCETTLKFRPSEIENGKAISSGTVDGVELRVRRKKVSGIHFLTASVVNANRYTTTSRRSDDLRVYQVGIAAETEDGTPLFVTSPNTARRPDSDYWQQELIYRNVRQYAVGHGCSVTWTEDPVARRARVVKTEWIPECDVPKASADVMGDQAFLELDYLGDPANYPALLTKLRALPEAYAAWVEDLRRSVDSVVGEFSPGTRERIQEAALANIKQCVSQKNRIEAGINYLESDDIALEAFMLANRAIGLSMKKVRPADTPKWFPFQLAFILLVIPSIGNRNHPERRILDLIWFPTGGGKTEAYLGLSAFTLFYRGISAGSPDEAGGTSIITRYTLRTLTVQQFERTALAIMSCESVRRKHPTLSRHAGWSIGLLVGSASTPKWIARRYPNDGSAEDLLSRGDKEAKGALLPLRSCPWCGTVLGLGDVSISGDKRSVETRCSNEGCEFSSGIPTRIIDEHIVNAPPSFVVATIDKFAQLAWEPGLSNLLRGDEVRPLDMIIQDELHLISDTLGTVAGLYETAIDAIASPDGIGPKIVGATATIRRAEEQVRSLFLRDTRQFPPSGLDAGDSFFYREENDNSVPGRKYIGIHAQGRSPKHTLPRILATVAQSSIDIVPDNVRDDYFTIVTYFNSLRELGGALVIAEDDVPAYQSTLSEISGKHVRPLSQIVEMTSQVPSYQIPDRLDQLRVSLLDKAADREPVDLVLATNMISVGVDVSRLGLMVINGQPKTTSEYIQASSRVGRPKGHAGLVITQYNWIRSRDRSHYERFLAYHRSFYRFVEPVSVTPFSARARDRALEGVVASMVRAMVPELTDNAIPMSPATLQSAKQRLSVVRNNIMRRVGDIDQRETSSTRDQLDSMIETLEVFLDQAQAGHRYWIRWRVPSEEQKRGVFMLTNRREGDEFDSWWEAMLSMRDTDTPAPLKLTV